MRILLLAGYYHPEAIGSGVWIRQLAIDLRDKGHAVTVLTGFPNYPHGRIFPGYRNAFRHTEQVDGIRVIRTYTYATPSKEFWPRVASFGSFCASSLLAGLPGLARFDVVYAILPPLPLGVSAWALAKATRARLVVNIQDIYPDIAVDTGFLKNRGAIAFFRRMERWIYARAERIVVISEGFRDNLRAKGVPESKLAVISNWADPDFITPGDRDNRFRRELGLNGNFVVLYSGSLGQNSDLTSLLDAAALVRETSFTFLIVGDGLHKESLVRRAEELGLRNVQFLPFQPLDRYAEVLAAADATVVTLNTASTFSSVPSKVYKQMAARRPVVAVAHPSSDLARLVRDSGAGYAVPPGDPARLADVLRHLSAHPEQRERMGRAAREYLTQVCSRSRCVDQIEQACAATA